MRPPLLFALLAACASNTGERDVVAVRQLPAELKDDAAAISRANNQFACDVYGQLAAEAGNHFFSPFSISTALAMTDAGAAGTTDLELRAALHLGLPSPRTHQAIGALLASLDTGRALGAYTLTTANGMFGQRGFPFQTEFTTILTRDYRAELTPVDFASAPEAARTSINTWVAARTDHKVPELFAAGVIDASARLVLANAIVFKGTWERRFDPSATSQQPFHLASGQTVQVAMMQKSDPLATAAIPGGTLGILPFGGKDLSMVVVLPDAADGLPAIEAQLGGDAIAHWMALAHATQERPLALPRLSLDSSADLVGVLSNLGVTTAFDPLAADFSGIDGRRDLVIQTIIHKAVFNVDEDGAEAAAATGVVVAPASLPTPFIADHPFVFFIFDHVTGTILFMGRVTDPT